MLSTREDLNRLTESEIREFAASLLNELRFKQALIDKLTYEWPSARHYRRSLPVARFGTNP